MRSVLRNSACLAMAVTAFVAVVPLVLAGCQAAAGGSAAVMAKPVAEETTSPAQATKPDAQESSAETETPTVELPAGVVARVNGEDITRDELVEILLKHYGQRALESVIQQRVIRQEAAKLNVQVSEADLEEALTEFYSRGRFAQGMPLEERKKRWTEMLAGRGITLEDFKRDMRAEILLKKVVARRVTVTDEMVRAEFDRRHGRKLLLREIVVADERKAKEIHAELEGGADFADLARKHSTNRREGREGGKIRVPVARGTRTRGFEDAAWALEAGQFSKPVKVGRTWLILKLDGRTEPDGVKFEDVKATLHDDIAEREERRMRGQVLGELMDKADIDRRRRLTEPEAK